MVRPTNLGAARELTDAESSAGVFVDDDADWPTSPTGSSEPSPRDQWKQPVRAATTTNITISTALNNGDTLDGVTLATGDRVLVKDQSTTSQNGIYVVGTTPTRAVDFDESDEVLGGIVYVYDGTANTGTTWIVDLTAEPEIDVDPILFIGFAIATTNAELNIEGGQSVIMAHGSTGSTETIDPTDGNVHTLTLDADCTITLNAPSGSGACSLELWVTEDGTGGWTITWPGSVTEQGTHTTTLGTTQRVILETIDGGTSWIATWIGSGEPIATAHIADTSDAHDASAISVLDTGGYLTATDVEAALAELAARIATLPTSAGAAFTVIGQEERISNGATTTWTLDNDFEENSVSARNLTTGVALSVTEGTSPSVTISAAGSAGDRIAFSYAASAT